MVVDDYFPYCPHKAEWAFSRANGNELWVLLMEKAWAKVFGSYQRIEAGTSGEALPCITGAPIEVFFHEEQKENDSLSYLWEKLKASDKKNYIIGTSVSSDQSNSSGQKMNSVGLVDAHAYSLISVFDEVD